MFVAVVMGVSACQFTPNEIARITSPDATLDVVLSEADCGAACPFIYHLSIVPRGKPPLKVPKHDLFTATHLTALTIRWLGPRVLEIAYSTGDISYIAEAWEPQGQNSSNSRVTLRLLQRPPTAAQADTIGLCPDACQ
jgi:hypothetical protein